MASGEDVHEALVLVEQLRVVPDSRYAAACAGGPQFLGWSERQQILASIRDILLGIGSGLGGSSITEADMWPRPEKDEPVGSIADFNVNDFMRRLAS